MPLPTGVITTSEGLELEVVNSYKYLLHAKVQSRLDFFYRNCSSFTPAAKLTLIQMNILAMLDYGDVIYRSAVMMYCCLYLLALCALVCAQ